jgi:hypothetical protein
VLRDQTNNRINPANARQADVARKALEEIAPIQQKSYRAAFSTAGYQAVLYSRIQGGSVKCSCKAHRKIANTLLGIDGKADVGVINELLTGAVHTTNRYDSAVWANNGFDSPEHPAPDGNNPNQVTAPNIQGAPFFGLPYDIRTQGGEYPNEQVAGSGADFGDNGPVRTTDLDQLVHDWDSGVVRTNEVGCPVCYGTGYIGGFTALYGWRVVLTPMQVTLTSGQLDLAELPWAAENCQTFQFVLTLPRGYTALDSITLWNGTQKVPYTLSYSGTQVTPTSLRTLCDGTPKLFVATVTSGYRWTHFEWQFNLGNWDSTARFEFPKLPKSKANLLEPTEPFQIVLDPGVPQEVKIGDIIVESVNGRALIVGEVTPWNTQHRMTLGQLCTVRPVQPMEYFNLLPRRGYVSQQDKAVQYQHDNQNGPRRT